MPECPEAPAYNLMVWSAAGTPDRRRRFCGTWVRRIIPMRIWTFRIDLGKNAFHLAWSIASAAGHGFACSALVFFRRFGSRILRIAGVLFWLANAVNGAERHCLFPFSERPP